MALSHQILFNSILKISIIVFIIYIYKLFHMHFILYLINSININICSDNL